MGPQMIHSIIHRRGGPVFFMLSLIPLLFLVWWLRLMERKRGNPVLQDVPTSSAMPGLQASAGVNAKGSEVGSVEN
jgi:ABC-type transporter Mla subunit MlaD